MQAILSVIQILLSILLTVGILIQAQGSGLGATWGGGGETYHTKRGLERVMYYATIAGVGLFVLLVLAIHIS